MEGRRRDLRDDGMNFLVVAFGVELLGFEENWNGPAIDVLKTFPSGFPNQR